MDNPRRHVSWSMEASVQDVNDMPLPDEGLADPPGRERALGSHGIFPMRVAVQLTGLTPDTIRAWERRYGAIEPSRSAGNTRKFTQDDIRRLLLLREATEAGHSIGNIAGLDEEALRALRAVTRPAPEPPPGSDADGDGTLPPVASPGTDAVALERYLGLLQRFDVAAQASWVRRAAALSAPRDFVLGVVSPLLSELRERRADARLGGPHVVVAWQALAAALQTLLDVGGGPARAPEVLTVGAPRQRHAIGAMAAAVLAREHGHASLFLGPSVPDADVLWAVDALATRVLVVDVSVPLSVELGPGSLGTFDRMGARQPVWVLWPQGASAAEVAHVERLTDLADVDRRLASLAPRARGGEPR